MRILFIANTFPSPDSPKMAPFNLRAVNNLTEAGMDVKVYHLRSWKPGRKVTDNYTIDNVNITSVALPFYAFSPARIKAWNIGLYKRWFYKIISRQIDLSSVDVIHTVGVAHAGIIGAYVSQKTGKPHIAQCIGSDINYVLPEMKEYSGVKGFDQYVDIFAGNSHSLANEAKKNYPDKPTAVVYRGINLDNFYPDPSKRPADKLVFSFIGGISVPNTQYIKNEKGAVSMLNAWKTMITENPGLKVELQYGGPRVSKEEVTEILGAQPEDLKINVIGHVSRFEVLNFLQRTHVLVMPSMWDGFPNAGVEASACGCAVIGSTAGGIPELINGAQNGILFEPGDEKALVEAMLKLIHDRELLETYMSRSRPFVEKNLDYKQFAQGYKALYNQLVKK